jgi:hypothetical protein
MHLLLKNENRHIYKKNSSKNFKFLNGGQKYPWVIPLGTTLPKSQESWTQFKK